MSITSDFWKAMNQSGTKVSGSNQKPFSSSGSVKNTSGGSAIAPTSTKKKKKKSIDEEFWEAMGDDDIAPVSSVADRVQARANGFALAPVASSTGKKDKDEEEQEDKRSWFQKGVFEDGYQDGDISKAILGTLADVGQDALTGIVGMGESALDAFMTIAPYSMQSNNPYMPPAMREQQNQIIAQAKKESAEFVAKDLYDEEAVAKKILASVAGNAVNYQKLQGGQMLTADDLAVAQEYTKYAQQYFDDRMEAQSVLGEKSDALMQSAGVLAAQAGLQAVGLPWYLTSGVTSFGSEAENALKQGATHEEAVMSGAISAVGEIVSEKMFGGDIFTKNGADLATKYLSRNVSNKIVRNLLKAGYDVAGEGFEEAVSQVVSRLGSSLYKDETLKEILTSEEALDEYLESAIGGMVLGGGMTGINVAKSNEAGVDYTTGLTENEQKVVDKLYKEYQTEDMDSQEKKQLYDDILRGMDRGTIDADTIAEILDTDSHKAYDSLTKESEEFKELYKTPFEKLSAEQNDRLKELQAKHEAKKYEKALEEARNKRFTDTWDLVRGTRLEESFREKLRMNEDFVADFDRFKGSKYEEAARKTLQNAVEFESNGKKLSNTNATHDVIDLAANISSQTGKVVYFKDGETIKQEFITRQTAEIAKLEQMENRTEEDNKLLAEMKDILAKVESGKTKVNGDITADGITLNLDSENPLEFTVGHEVTHSLEKAKVYDKLRDALYSYAKAKGVDIDAETLSRKAKYAGIENADAEKELVADLVGGYIFSDYDFALNLSTEHRNVAQKVYDEIKHLCKLATAGSKAARDLERAKRQFEKAFREAAEGKAQTDTQHSLSETDNTYFDAVNRGDTETAQRMVDEAAKNAGYDIKAYHGTKDSFTVFKNGQENQYDSGYLGSGFYFTDKRDSAEDYSQWKKGYGEKKVMDSALRMTNPLVIEDSNKPHLIAVQEALGLHLTDYDNFMARPNKQISDAITAEAKKQGYDGIIRYSELYDETTYVVFDSNQVKSADAVTYGDSGNVIPLSERFNKDNPDIRFSLSESVEETKDLVALHNLTGEKLMKSLELGGMPMPSLAVTKADIPHSNFGEITLIFGRETIDPKKNKKNKVYSADAWTPVFPRTEYEADTKVANRASQKLRELGNKVDDYFQRDLGRVSYGFEDYLDSEGGEEGLIQRVMDNYGMKAAYLEDSGKHIEKVTKQEEAKKDYNPNNIDKYHKIMDILGVTTAEEISKVNLKDARDNHGAELEVVFPGITSSALRMGRFFGIVKSYLEDTNSAPVYNTVTDANATQRLVDEALDQEGYEAWVRNLFSGIVKDSGIYNNKERFTPSGNRRTFKQTHIPVTLENIVKAMASQNNGNAKNVSGFNGVKTLRASTAETFKSVDQMHQRKGRLQNLTQEQFEAITNDLQDRLYKVIETIDNESGQIGGSNPFIRYDSIGETIAEIGENGKNSVADVKRFFGKYSRNISDDTALAVKRLLDDVAEMPVNLFEAKPERVVGFDEAKVFVIPYDADVKLKQELLNRGYSIAEYDPKVEGDRQRVVNQFEEYKFSLSDAGKPFRRSINSVYGKDIMKQNPFGEIAPVVNPNNQPSKAWTVEEMFPDEPTHQTELNNLVQEKESLENQMLEMGNTGDFSNFDAINDRYVQVQGRIAELEGEISEAESARANSLDDADAPPEMEAPYYESEGGTVSDPFYERDIADVGNRKVKAYMYENPEVKPFFQEAANVMLGDLHSGMKGEKIFNDEVYYASGGEKGWMGTKRQTTDDIAELLDQWHYTYAEIEKGLKAIIEDNGKENNAVSKRIEFMLNDRLMNGYTGVWGEQNPPNQAYIDLLYEKQINEYSKEAFDAFMETADQYAPEDVAPVKPLAKAAPDDIAPVYETKDGQTAMFEPVDEPVNPTTRKELHQGIMDNIKATFKAKGLDFDNVLNKAKNLSTWATVDNTPQRVMEKSLGYKEGGVLADLTVNKVAQNESEGIKWLNSRVELLKQVSKQYNIKPGSKQSAAAQMYAEGFYVNENNEIIRYGDPELIQDFPDPKVRANIKGLASDPRIRRIYDETLSEINESRTRNAYPEIPRLDNYFLHFRAMEDTFSRLGLPFNPNDIRAKDLPTDLNGVTADLKPGQPYFASAMHRKGKRTSFDMLGGIEKYLSSAKNQIYHIDDIQTLRALRNYIAETYGQATGLEDIDSMSDTEAEERIKQVYGSHLSTFAKFLNEEANVLAGKTALIDRGIEGIIGRRGITFLNTLNKQVGSNMVGYNISSSLTNFLPVAQTFAKTNKFDFTKAFAQTVANKVSGGRFDSFAEDSPVVIRRKGEERFYRTPWQKIADPGYALMSAVDDISTELIARTKYNELTRKGMDSQKAHFETDKWVSRLMGDRSLGQQPQLYNSKMLGLVTKFQLEVRNQLDSQFYDTIQETKASNEDIENGLLRNAKTAAKVASTFTQLAVVQHLFGMAFESIAGYNPAFDIIEVLMTAFGYDDEEESEDTALDNLEQGFMALLEDLPYASTFTGGGRIPISSALPVQELIKGEDKYGNEKSRLETLGEVAPYYVMPGGYGQAKKTYQGLKMFSDEHPIAGSYTDAGNLRFPVEDTLGNRIKAGIFGQYASENARKYFDQEQRTLNPEQTEILAGLDIPIEEYWEYRDNLYEFYDVKDKLLDAAYADGATDEDVLKGLYVDAINDELYGLYDQQKEIASGNSPLKRAKLRDIQTQMSNLLTDSKNEMDNIHIDGYYATIGDKRFDYSDYSGRWYKIEGEYLEREQNAVNRYGITPSDYWNNTDLYYHADWYFDDKYATVDREVVAKLVYGGKRFAPYAADLGQIKGEDLNGDGKTDSGTKKNNIIDYINDRNDLDFGEKVIMLKMSYPAEDSYNMDIIEYLNSRDDIDYQEMKTILEELGMEVDSKGNITWD